MYLCKMNYIIWSLFCDKNFVTKSIISHKTSNPIKNKRSSELKKVVVVSVLKFMEIEVKELLKFGIHSVESKPSNFQTIMDLQRNILLK